MSSRVKGIEFPYFYLSVPFSSWGASLLRKRVEDLSVGGDVATFLRDEELGVFVLDDNDSGCYTGTKWVPSQRGYIYFIRRPLLYQ